MGFDINGFKNAFLAAMRNASNLESKDNQINTNKEKLEAGMHLSAFKEELAKISNPIGDIATFSTKAKAQEVTVDDLLSYVDKDIAAKVNHYIATKPVMTINPMQKPIPTLAEKMAGMAEDVDVDKLNAFLDMAYNSETAARIGSFVTDNSPEDMALAEAIGTAYELE